MEDLWWCRSVWFVKNLQIFHVCMHTSREYIQYTDACMKYGVILRWNFDCLYQEDKTRYPQMHTNAVWFIDYDKKSQARTVGVQNTQIAGGCHLWCHIFWENYGFSFTCFTSNIFIFTELLVLLIVSIFLRKKQLFSFVHLYQSWSFWISLYHLYEELHL